MTLKQHWLYFRVAHASYTGFALQMANFIIIAYSLFLSKIADIGMVEFVLLFSAAYIPVATVIGRLHMKKQAGVEQTAYFENNPIFARIFLLQMKMIEGTATKAEVEKEKDYLAEIAERK